jgi:kynurenine formamidase
VRDDVLDDFYPQSSSQWDALCHIRHPQFGNYNAVLDSEIFDGPGSRLGIDKWSRQGVAGRGVLLDVARHAADRGTPIDPFSATRISVELLESTADAQHSELRVGDILVVHTGFTDGLLDEPDRVMLGPAEQRQSAGLDSSHEMIAYLWDHHFAAVASDSPGVEASEPAPGVEPWNLHKQCIPLLGLPFGELWRLDALADSCAADQRWDFLLVSVPLNIRGGTGSPAQVMAIK